MLTFVDGGLVNAEDSWSGEPSTVDAEAIRYPDLRRFYSLWDEKRGSRRFPGPGEINPRDMLYMLAVSRWLKSSETRFVSTGVL